MAPVLLIHEMNGEKTEPMFFSNTPAAREYADKAGATEGRWYLFHLAEVGKLGVNWGDPFKNPQQQELL